MQNEVKENRDEQAIVTKNLFLATGLIAHDPELLFELYPEDFGLRPEEEAQLDLERPESPEEAMAMLHEAGFQG